MSAKIRKAGAYPATRGAALAVASSEGGPKVFWQRNLLDLLDLVNRWAGSDCIGPEVSLWVADRGRWVPASR